MVELIFLFFVVPRRVRRLARERQISAFFWIIAAIGAWIGSEIVMFTIIAILSEVLKLPGAVLALGYALALLSGALGANMVLRRLAARPVSVKEATIP